MNFPDYSHGFSGNFSQIGSGTFSSVSVKRKAEESKVENQEEKATGLAEQRFNGNYIEEPPSKRRKVVEGGQKGKEKIDEDKEAPKQEESKMAGLWQETLSSEEANNQEFPFKKEIDHSTLIPFPFFPKDALSDDSKEKEIATTEQLWEFLDECLPRMSESYFYFNGTQIHKDIIKELLKNPPDDSLDRLLERLCAHQTILCINNQQIIITGFEKILLEQKSQVLKSLFEDNPVFQEANSQNSISWAIDEKIFKILLKSLYQPNILLDGQKELNEEEKEKIFIDLLDQANQCEIKELKRDLISWFQRKLSLLDKQKNENLEKIVNWHTFARCRELISLQKSCEDFLIKSFLAAKDDQEMQCFIEKLKRIQMTSLDLSAYSDNDEYNFGDLATTYLVKVNYLIKELSLTELNLGSCPWLNDNDLALLRNLPLKKLTIVNSDITDDGLIHLKNMPLEELSLPGSDLTDEGLIYLQDFKNLRVLDLAEFGIGSTGKGLIHLKDLPLQTLILKGNHLRNECMTPLKHFTNLQMLDLGIAAVGKDFLAPLADLPRLRIFHLVIPEDVDNLTHLKKLPLEELWLFYTHDVIGSHDLENLEGLPLERLSLISEQGIEDGALTHLKKLPLEGLQIYDKSGSSSSGLTNAGVAHLGDLSSLKILGLGGANLTGDCLIHLKNLSRLEELYCQFETIKSGDLENLERSPLKKLVLNCNGIDDVATLTHLKKWHLEELEIIDYNNGLDCLTDEDVAHLADVSSLKKLKLEAENLTGGCLIHLRTLFRLEELYCCDVGTIKSGDLGNLEGLPLRKLSLISCCGIEDAALTDLKKLHFLEELNINDSTDGPNSLTNAGVAHLGDLSSLKKLTLVGEKLTGACLIHLRNLSHLEELSYGFPIEDNDLFNLKKKLPLLKINKLQP